MKKFILFFLLFFSPLTFAQNNNVNDPNASTIHTTILKSNWCYNLTASTKVGTQTAEGKCNYTKETPPRPIEGGCKPLKLNGGVLQELVGPGFTCAATHVHGNVSGKDAVDEYQLIADAEGRYMGTHPNQGNVVIDNKP
jgi:hypothetical protein